MAWGIYEDIQIIHLPSRSKLVMSSYKIACIDYDDQFL